MRLIDVDLLVDMLAMEPMENRTYLRANEIVTDMPTAYDMDKVVEWLIANSMFVQEYVEPLIFLDDAIEIVKSVGIE